MQYNMYIGGYGEKSISQVGEEAGFVSSAHFSHVFKKMTGVTPTEYRVSHRDEL